MQQLASQVPQNTLSALLSGVFQLPETGTFGDNVSQLYGQPNPQRQAGILTKLVQAAGVAMWALRHFNKF